MGKKTDIVKAESFSSELLRTWAKDDLVVANEGRKAMQELLPCAVQTVREILSGEQVVEGSGFNGGLTKSDSRIIDNRLKACALVFKHCLPNLDMLSKEVIVGGGNVENIDKQIKLNIQTDSVQNLFNKKFSVSEED